ncbi:calcium-activated chloride channel regulator 4 [Trichechus manatus latirostris]|uniref:Calcium-activated chloride channel regulator 4 n=1 Tax=Trichechus manatus latirostris TaxID=127582 RepID=A0A2Y9R757_TRIMA|nr:calcium-activated chloride channel regulator 4 [Trichechus manatus latirostris]
MVAPPPQPAFSLLKISQRIVCLVLDKSGSMASGNRLNRMNQAAKYFLLQIVENGSWVGMVHFDSSAYDKSQLIQIISSNERNKLSETLPTTASGGTSICSGIKSAFQMIKHSFHQTDGSEIVLLTDGEDNTVSSCMEDVKQSGAIIHLIALGPSADQAVIEMTNITGGLHQLSSDQAENNGLIDAFGALASGNTDISQQDLQMVEDSNGILQKAFKSIITEYQKSARFTVDTNSRMAHLSIAGIAKVGIWTYSLKAQVSPETLTITVTSRASNSSVPPITVNAKMNKDTNSYPSPMIVYAEVQQGYFPVLGANVTAFIESQSGKMESLELLDNGAGADSFKNDGVYSRYFIAYRQNGRYSLKVQAQGGTNAVTRSLRHPLNKALYIPGWVVNVPQLPVTFFSLVQQYIIRTSGSILDLRDNFDDALQVNTTDLLPNEANSKETFTFKPGNISEENATHIFIAIQSVDKSNLTSKVSNTAQVALFIPQADSSPDENPQNPSPGENHHNTGVNISTLVLSVIGSVVVFSIILSTTICILKKKKNVSRPSTGF